MVSRLASHPTNLSVTTARNTRPTPATNPYDPNTDGAGRRCSACGGRAGWRRSLALGGAWVHCSAAEPSTRHGSLAHSCSVLCGSGVAA